MALGDGESVAEVEGMFSAVVVGAIEGGGVDTAGSSVGLMSECLLSLTQ